MGDKPEEQVVETAAQPSATDLLKNTTAPATEQLKVESTDEGSAFDIDFDDKPAVTAEDRVKFKREQFKELDDDIDTDDEEFDVDSKTAKLLDRVLSRGKEYKEKTNQYKSLAEANTVIENDDHIKSWREHRNLDDEKLIHAIEFAKYKGADLSDEEAAQKAQESVEELREESEKLFKRRAEDIRLELSQGIKNRTKELQSQIQSTSKALSLSNAPDPTLIEKAIEKLSKTDNFLGLTFGGKTESGKKDFLKPIEASIKDGSLIKKIQNDPDLLAEFALYSFGKDKFKNAIEKRTPSKKQILEKLSAAPHSNGPTGAVKPQAEAGDASGLKNPKGFR